VFDLEKDFYNRDFQFTNWYTKILPVYLSGRSGRNPVSGMAPILK
jgi:hypothetical protein